jgi:hypothetical protein
MFTAFAQAHSADRGRPARNFPWLRLAGTFGDFALVDWLEQKSLDCPFQTNAKQAEAVVTKARYT